MKPQSRMLDLHKGETGAEAIVQIEEQGGIAWVRPEYGSDMGHENVYWGERLFFFTPEQVATQFLTQEQAVTEPCRCVYPDKCFCTPEQREAGASAPATKLFISHSAHDWEGNVKWFVVEPQSDPSDQVASLREIGRTVVEINVPDSRVQETPVEDEEPPICEKCGERHYKRGPFRPAKSRADDEMQRVLSQRMKHRDEILWGEDAPIVRVVSDALFGQHPERGGQEREQAAFAIVQALKAAELL